MRVFMVSQGTRGDVQPFIAAAQELRARGHTVGICCPCSSAGLVRAHGFEAFGMTFDTKKVVMSPQMQAAMETGDGNACIAAFFEAQHEQESNGANTTQEADAFIGQFKPDVILGHPSILTFAMLAEKHQAPVVNTMFMPFLPSRESHTAFSTKAALKEQGLLDNPLAGHRHVFTMLFNDALLAVFNALRASWGLQPYQSASEVQAVYQAIPTANCWSAAMLSEPADMRTEFPLARQTGYLFADEPTDYEPPNELLSFLEAPNAEKPVYVGFGSLSAGDPRLLTEKVLRALILAGRKRCVLVGGWSGIGPEHLHPELTEGYEELTSFAESHVVKVNAAPHSWLLPKCVAAVHHGGAGTVGAVAHAGLPMAIAAFAWDQPVWAERIEELGIGVDLKGMITTVSAEDLSQAIAAIMGDVDMIARAATLGARIRAEESGNKHFVDFVEASLSSPFPWATAARPLPTCPPPPLWDRPAGKEATQWKEEAECSEMGPTLVAEAPAMAAAVAAGA